MITEFGWDPTLMRICDYTQDEEWANVHSDPDKQAACNVADSRGSRRFISDIDAFQVLYLHRAETMTVWITSGWFDDRDGTDRANGLNEDGTWKQWFTEYYLYIP